MSPPISTAMKPGWRRQDIEVGTILVSPWPSGIGCFYQVVHRTAKSLVVRSLQSQRVSGDGDSESDMYMPMREVFRCSATFDRRVFIKPDGYLGSGHSPRPWAVWDGKPRMLKFN